MFVKKLILACEVLAGTFLILSVVFQLKETGFEAALGADLDMTHGVSALGVFYIVRALAKLIIELSDPSESI